MTLHLDLPYLNYILDIIADIENSAGNISKDKFLKEKDIKEANVRRIEMISETIKNLSVSLKNKYKDNPWENLAIIKTKIADQYFGVDFNIIWEVLKKDIPLLKENILKIREDIQKGVKK